jgi:hypothetical protein
MKRMIFFLVLILAAGFSCKKKEQPPVPPPQEQPAKAGPTTPEAQPAQTSQTTPEAQPVQEQIGQFSRGEMLEVGIVAADGSSTTTITWIAGKNVRQEKYQGVGAGKKLGNIIISRPDGIYMLNPEGKTAMKLREADNPVSPINPQYEKTDWDSLMNELDRVPGAKIEDKGIQKWEGQGYHVVRVGSEDNRMFRVYYIQDGKVKRVVLHNPRGRMSSDVRINQKVGEDAIPPGTFDIPDGYQIQEPQKAY